jgi:LmbE family N-acetylglucosaminyl deacetylase
VATATRGEGGTADPDRLPPEVLGPLREIELATSLDAVGVSEHYWLDDDLRDGTLAGLSRSRGRRLVSNLLTAIRPDLIITFGPDGLTGHPDHRAISRWVTDAWIAAGRHGELWHAAITEQFLDQWGDLCEDLGVWMTPDSPRAIPSSAVVHLQRCDATLRERKMAALRAHASQTTDLIAWMGEPTFARMWCQEAFTPAR